MEPFEIFDPHFHIWDVSEGGHAHNTVLGPVNGNECFDIKLYEADLDKVPKEFQHAGGVFLEAASVLDVDIEGPEHQKKCLQEAEWAIRNIAANSRRKYVYVPSACLEDPNVETTLQQLSTLNPKIRGIRQILNHEPSWPRNAKLGNLLENPEFCKGYSQLAKFDLSFDAQLNPSQFELAAKLFTEHPSVPVIINHLGTPTLADLTEEKQRFWSGMETFAALPHVSIKISMLGYIDKKWNENEVVKDAVHRIINLFGIDRCMVASNHPSDLTDQNWTPYSNYEAFRQLFDKLSISKEDQRKLFATNAKRIYRVR